MGFLERTVWRLFTSPPSRDPFTDKLAKPPGTPSHNTYQRFELPSASSSSSSDSLSSSLSSASTFWMQPTPSRWSASRYIPAKLRNAVSKRQFAVIVCICLALVIWMTPPPNVWRGEVIHITVEQPLSNPYQVLRPVTVGEPKKHAPDPAKWLQQNSENKQSEHAAGNGPWAAIPGLPHTSKKPKAALISLVRNSELPGLVQSMTQLELHWNHKYKYPWIFFNDEEFSDEFKVNRTLVAWSYD